jgi:hypothetical protein
MGLVLDGAPLALVHGPQRYCGRHLGGRRVSRYNRRRVDTIRTLAQQRHFFTVELRLGGYGQVLVIGDQAAVERITQLVAEHHEHELINKQDDT